MSFFATGHFLFTASAATTAYTAENATAATTSSEHVSTSFFIRILLRKNRPNNFQRQPQSFLSAIPDYSTDDFLNSFTFLIHFSGSFSNLLTQSMQQKPMVCFLYSTVRPATMSL